MAAVGVPVRVDDVDGSVMLHDTPELHSRQLLGPPA